MQIHRNGLQESLNLIVSKSLGAHGGLSDGSRAQRRDGFQVLHQQGTGSQRRIGIIVGYLGLTGSQQLLGSTLGNIEESVDLVALNGLSGFRDAGIMGHDA